MSKKNKTKILLIEDDKIDGIAFKKFVRNKNLQYDITTSTSVKKTGKALKKNNFDLVLSKYELADGTALDIIKLSNNTPVIIIAGQGDEKTVVKALKNGAVDYLIKDAGSKYLNILPHSIENALIKKKAEEELILSEKLEAIIEFANAACHELSQPMTVISCYSEMLLKNNSTNTDLKEKLSKIQEQIERMAIVIHKFQHINQYKTKNYIDRKIVDIDKSSAG